MAAAGRSTNIRPHGAGQNPSLPHDHEKTHSLFRKLPDLQLAALLAHLPGWTERYVPDRTLRVDMLTRERCRHFLAECETADTLCVQPVHAEHFYEARTQCVLDYARRHGKRVLIVPYLHFSGYAPHMLYAHTNVGIYHCAASVACLMAGVELPRAQRIVTDFLRRPQEFFVCNAAASLEEMLRRERLLQEMHEESIPVSAWFARHFQHVLLMHAHNHPSPALFRHLLRELAGRLNLAADDVPLPDDFLQTGDHFPVHRGVQAALHLAPEPVSPLLRGGGRTYGPEKTTARCLSRLREVGLVHQALFGRPLPMRSRAAFQRRKNARISPFNKLISLFFFSKDKKSQKKLLPAPFQSGKLPYLLSRRGEDGCDACLPLNNHAAHAAPR